MDIIRNGDLLLQFILEFLDERHGSGLVPVNEKVGKIPTPCRTGLNQPSHFRYLAFGVFEVLPFMASLISVIIVILQARSTFKGPEKKEKKKK